MEEHIPGKYYGKSHNLALQQSERKYSVFFFLILVDLMVPSNGKKSGRDYDAEITVTVKR